MLETSIIQSSQNCHKQFSKVSKKKASEQTNSFTTWEIVQIGMMRIVYLVLQRKSIRQASLQFKVHIRNGITQHSRIRKVNCKRPLVHSYRRRCRGWKSGEEKDQTMKHGISRMRMTFAQEWNWFQNCFLDEVVDVLYKYRLLQKLLKEVVVWIWITRGVY